VEGKGTAARAILPTSLNAYYAILPAALYIIRGHATLTIAATPAQRCKLFVVLRALVALVIVSKDIRRNYQETIRVPARARERERGRESASSAKKAKAPLLICSAH